VSILFLQSEEDDYYEYGRNRAERRGIDMAMAVDQYKFIKDTKNCDKFVGTDPCDVVVEAAKPDEKE
jgi:hypothetical protein